MHINLMRALIGCALLLHVMSHASAQTGSAKTPAALNTEVNTLLPDQGSGAITPFNMRQIQLDVIASYPNSSSPGSITGAQIAAGTVTNSNLAGMTTATVKCGVASAPADCTATSWFDAAYCNTVGWLIVRFTGSWTCAQGMPANIEWWGASPSASAATNDTAIAAAVAALVAAAPNGAALLAPRNGYSVSNTITLTNNISLWCASSANDNVTGTFNAQTAGNTILVVNSFGSTVKDCGFSRAGGSPTGKGIAIGTDAVAVADAICTNTSGTVTSASNGFATAVAQMRIKLPSCGAGAATLFATITAVGGAGSITVSPVAGNTPGAGVSASYGFVYLEILLDHVKVINSNIGIHFIDAARFHVRDGFMNSNNTGAESMRVENQLSPDFGDSFIESTTFLTNDNTAGYGLHYESSGGLKIVNSKFLGGKYNVFLDWNLGVSGQFKMANNSLETCATSAIFISPAAQFNGVDLIGNNVDCGAPNIVFDNASAAVTQGAVISGNNCSGGGGTCLDTGKVNYPTVVGNISNTGGGNPAFNIRVNTANGLFANNNAIGATVTYANASTTTKIDDMVGMTTAQLLALTAAANGSRIFATDADPATSPCTHAGGQTGSTAFRQNGAWKCF
jgi:hypothetical protein